MLANLRSTSAALTPTGLTVLRAVVGLIMAVHGWLKLVDFDAWRSTVAQLGVPAPSLMAALSTVAELGGGLALAVGLFTPLASLFLLVNLVVAIVLVHGSQGLLAQNGGFEYPLVLAAVAFFFLLRGGGPISLDRALFGRRTRARRASIAHEARA